MADKTIIDKINQQLDMARKIGNPACAFSIEETREILALIDSQHEEFVRMENSWRREVERVRAEYDEDWADHDAQMEDYGPPEDRDCAYWERVFRDGL